MRIGGRITLAVLILSIISPAFAQTQWTPIGPEGGWVDDIVFHPDNSPQTVYAATLNNLYQSADAGASWQPLGLPNLPLPSLVMHPVNPQVLFAGVYRFGVHKSTDGGDTWEDFSDGLLNKEISRLALDANLGVMYASTVGYGVYKHQMLIATSVADDLRQPDEFLLFQNYPNPFNPQTTIRYQLQEAGRVTLAIYNMLGQEVRTLVNKSQSAGSHSVVWDGKNDAGELATSGCISTN